MPAPPGSSSPARPSDARSSISQWPIRFLRQTGELSTAVLVRSTRGRAHRNCASQRLVGNVWCTPRYLDVYVRPLVCPLALDTLGLPADPARSRSARALRRGAGPACRTRFTMPQSGTLTLSSCSSECFSLACQPAKRCQIPAGTVQVRARAAPRRRARMPHALHHAPVRHAHVELLKVDEHGFSMLANRECQDLNSVRAGSLARCAAARAPHAARASPCPSPARSH